MIDIQVIVTLFVIFLCQVYITFVVFRLTGRILAAITAFTLPFGIGLFIIQVLLLERKYPKWNIEGHDRYWLQWSYIFVMVQYIGAFIMYMDFLNYGN